MGLFSVPPFEGPGASRESVFPRNSRGFLCVGKQINICGLAWIEGPMGCWNPGTRSDLELLRRK